MLKPVNVLKQPVWFHSCQVTLSRNGLSREHHLQSHFARHSTAHCNPWGGTEQSHVDAARRYPGTRSVIGYYWLSLVTAKYQFFPLAITNPCWYCRSRRHSKDNEKDTEIFEKDKLQWTNHCYLLWGTCWIASSGDGWTTHAIILTDSISPDWNVSMVDTHLWTFLWVYCPGQARVKGF